MARSIGNSLFRWVGCAILAGAMTVSCLATASAPNRATPLTLGELEAFCQIPADCDQPLKCDGMAVSLVGTIAPDAIFDHTHFPSLPYEKFTLRDRDGRSIEIWPKSKNNKKVFEKLHNRTQNRVVVSGHLERVRMATGSRCTQGVRVRIDDASQIEFKSD